MDNVLEFSIFFDNLKNDIQKNSENIWEVDSLSDYPELWSVLERKLSNIVNRVEIPDKIDFLKIINYYSSEMEFSEIVEIANKQFDGKLNFSILNPVDQLLFSWYNINFAYPFEFSKLLSQLQYCYMTDSEVFLTSSQNQLLNEFFEFQSFTTVSWLEDINKYFERCSTELGTILCNVHRWLKMNQGCKLEEYQFIKKYLQLNESSISTKQLYLPDFLIAIHLKASNSAEFPKKMSYYFADELYQNKLMDVLEPLF